SAQECRLADERAVQAVALAKRRDRTRPPPPLERDHVEDRPPGFGAPRVHLVLREDLHRPARPLLDRARRPLGRRRRRERAKHGGGGGPRRTAWVRVTSPSAPPETRTTASPRHSCASVKRRPSTSSPSHASTSSSASSASRSGSGRPVSHHPSSRRSAGR